jgi:hypothetical protein
MTEITVATAAGNKTLWLGSRQGEAVYARKGANGPIMEVEASLSGDITKALGSLEDHRLWSGAISQVYQVIWGAPGKTWTAKKDKESWHITGPGQVSTKQPAARLEMALWDFQKLEAAKILPKASAPTSAAYSVELRDQAGKSLLHLEEIGPQGKSDLKIVTQVREKPVTVLIAQAPFRQWQDAMNRLTAGAQKVEPAQEKGETAKDKPK